MGQERTSESAREALCRLEGVDVQLAQERMDYCGIVWATEQTKEHFFVEQAIGCILVAIRATVSRTFLGSLDALLSMVHIVLIVLYP